MASTSTGSTDRAGKPEGGVNFSRFFEKLRVKFDKMAGGHRIVSFTGHWRVGKRTIGKPWTALNAASRRAARPTVTLARSGLRRSGAMETVRKAPCAVLCRRLWT